MADNLKGDRRQEQREKDRRSSGESKRDQVKHDSGRDASNKTANYVADKNSQSGKASPQERDRLHRDISKKNISNDDLKKGR